LSNGTSTGTMPVAGTSLTNTADFFIGKNRDGHYFSGTIDFTRVSKGTLADAETTIDELYKWEFDGPFLYDFAGNKPIGKRDAGALEKGEKLCHTEISDNPLMFDLPGGTKSITIDAGTGFEITRTVGDFFSYTVDGNRVAVTAQPLGSGSRTGAIYVYGCNETRQVKVVQQEMAGYEAPAGKGIKVMPNPVPENQPLTVSIPSHLKTSRATFTDISGKVLKESILTDELNTINVSLPKGFYLLNIAGEKHGFTTKIVIR